MRMLYLACALFNTNDKWAQINRMYLSYVTWDRRQTNRFDDSSNLPLLDNVYCDEICLQSINVCKWDNHVII